jgi:O-antigen ligase
VQADSSSPLYPRTHALRHTLLAACVALPWLQPFAPGPSSNVVPLLVAWGASLLAVLCAGAALPPAAWGVVSLAALLAWGSGAHATALAAAAAVASVAACAAAAAAAAPADRAGIARGIAAGWLVAAAASSAMALLQYFGAAGALAPWVNVADAGEAFANLRQRNQLATLTGIGLAALLGLAAGMPRRVAFVLVVVMALANAASASRTGLLQWLSIAGAVALWPGPHRVRWATLALAGLAAYAAGALALPLLLEAATGQSALNVVGRIAAPSACSTRSLLWPNVLELSVQFPWTGWGWGELDYAHYIHPYPGARFCDILDNAHNLPLHLAVELGWPVALGACVLAAGLLARARPWREEDPMRRIAWLALGALAVHSMVEYPLWYGPFQMALGLGLGLLWRPRSAPGQVRGVAVAAHGLRAGAAAAALAYAGWDYHRISQLYLAPEERAAAYRDDAMAEARKSWLFREQVRFAELSITPLTRANAHDQLALALDMLHFSPEPKVAERVIDAALLVGRDDLVAVHLARFRAAFPQEHEAWARERGVPARP